MQTVPSAPDELLQRKVDGRNIKHHRQSIPSARVPHRSSRPPQATRGGRSLTASHGLEQHVSTQDDLGAVGDGNLLAPAVGTAEDDSVEQAV